MKTEFRKHSDSEFEKTARCCITSADRRHSSEEVRRGHRLMQIYKTKAVEGLDKLGLTTASARLDTVAQTASA